AGLGRADKNARADRSLNAENANVSKVRPAHFMGELWDGENAHPIPHPLSLPGRKNHSSAHPNLRGHAQAFYWFLRALSGDCSRAALRILAQADPESWQCHKEQRQPA